VTKRPQPNGERDSLLAGEDDLFDPPDDSFERLDEWDSFQAYLVGEIGTHLHLLGLRSSDGERNDVCVVVKRPAFTGASELDVCSIGTDVGKINEPGDRGEFPMLVSVVETIEDREGVPSRSGWDRVERLRVVDDCPYRAWSAADHWSTYDLKFAGIDEDRERRASGAVGGGIDEMVKCAAEIVEGFADEERPMIGRGLSLDCVTVVVDLLGRSKLTLYSEFVSVSVLEGAGFPADRLHLFYAPAELPHGRGGHVHGVTSP
jgi:hypothetical protein